MTRPALRASLLGLVATLIALAGVAVVAEKSDAHSPSGGASCSSGVHAAGTNYSAADTNTVSVTLDGVTSSHVFTVNGDESLAIPSDGAPHSWSWSVSTTNPNPAYSAQGSGTITCGTPPVVVTPTPTPTPEPTPTPTPTPPVPPTVTPEPSAPPSSVPPVPTPTPTPTKPPTTPPGDTPPTVGPPPVRSSSVCVGNSLVTKVEKYRDHEWQTVSTSYDEGARRCRTPEGRPPVKEEGF